MNVADYHKYYGTAFAYLNQREFSFAYDVLLSLCCADSEGHIVNKIHTSDLQEFLSDHLDILSLAEQIMSGDLEGMRTALIDVVGEYAVMEIDRQGPTDEEKEREYKLRDPAEWSAKEVGPIK